MSTRSVSYSRRSLVRDVVLAGCSLFAAPMACGAIVNIDVSTFNGVNAGMNYNDSSRVITNFVPGGDLEIHFDTYHLGLDANANGATFRFANGGVDASPHNFAAGTDISAWAGNWSSNAGRTTFFDYDNLVTDLSPNFGPGSFMGFRFGSAGSWNYGWIEVTWNWTGDPQTSTFQIFAAAYESDVNTAIVAGATGAVPLPGAAGLAACGLLGVSRRRRR